MIPRKTKNKKLDFVINTGISLRKNTEKRWQRLL